MKRQYVGVVFNRHGQIATAEDLREANQTFHRFMRCPCRGELDACGADALLRERATA